MTTNNKHVATAIFAMLLTSGAFATPSAVYNKSVVTDTLATAQSDSTATATESKAEFPGGRSHQSGQFHA